MLEAPKMDNNLDMLDKANFDVETLSENFEQTLETFAIFVPTDVENLTKVPDDYDYDMETSHNIFFWDELLPTLIVYCLTFALGLVGNVLIIFTIFRYRKMKSTTNVFLASLASSDLLLILFCIPVKATSFSGFIVSFILNLVAKQLPIKIQHGLKPFLEINLRSKPSRLIKKINDCEKNKVDGKGRKRGDWKSFD